MPTPGTWLLFSLVRQLELVSAGEQLSFSKDTGATKTGCLVMVCAARTDTQCAERSRSFHNILSCPGLFCGGHMGWGGGTCGPGHFLFHEICRRADQSQLPRLEVSVDFSPTPLRPELLNSLQTRRNGSSCGDEDNLSLLTLFPNPAFWN